MPQDLPLTPAEIVRRLRMIAATDRKSREGRKAPSIASIAARANVSRRHIHRLILGRQMLSENSWRKLDTVLRQGETPGLSKNAR